MLLPVNWSLLILLRRGRADWFLPVSLKFAENEVVLIRLVYVLFVDDHVFRIVMGFRNDMAGSLRQGLYVNLGQFLWYFIHIKIVLGSCFSFLEHVEQRFGILLKFNLLNWLWLIDVRLRSLVSSRHYLRFILFYQFACQIHFDIVWVAFLEDCSLQFRRKFLLTPLLIFFLAYLTKILILTFIEVALNFQSCFRVIFLPIPMFLTILKTASVNRIFSHQFSMPLV